MKFPLLAFFAALPLAQIALAADSTDVPYTENRTINEHSVCKVVTNNSSTGLGLFVPTKTAAEWLAFRTYPPTGVTLTDCGCSAFAYVGGATDNTSRTTYTFTNVALGAADANRRIIVGISAGNGSATDVNLDIASVTVAGITATANTRTRSSGSTTGTYTALVPSGTTGTVVVTFSAAHTRASIATWRVIGLASNASAANNTEYSGPAAGSFASVPAGSIIVGSSHSRSGNAGSDAISWTGLTENASYYANGVYSASFASVQINTPQTVNYTVTATPTSTADSSSLARFTCSP